jgi:hypothetical protein
MTRTTPARRQGQPMRRQPCAPQRAPAIPQSNHGGLRRFFLDLIVGVPISAGIGWVFLACLGLV